MSGVAAEVVHESFEESIYHGTTFRWPFCRSYEIVDARVTDTACEILTNRDARSDKKVSNDRVRIGDLCQKMRDEKTAACLKTFFSIVIIIGMITALTFAGMHLYKLYKK